MRYRQASVFLAVVVVAGVGAGTTSAGLSRPALYKNCTHFNAKYPHGVGKVGARDHTSGTPVTNFKRSNAIYKLTMHCNNGLDRDRDGIACESG